MDTSALSHSFTIALPAWVDDELADARQVCDAAEPEQPQEHKAGRPAVKRAIEVMVDPNERPPPREHEQRGKRQEIAVERLDDEDGDGDRHEDPQPPERPHAQEPDDRRTTAMEAR